MRQKFHLSSVSLISGLLLCCALNGFAQNREKFVISAKAGGINAVTGQASMHAKGEADWQQLMITDDLEAGDRVRTASDGRVEILLNPGSYLRLGGNSEVELSNNSLANLEVKLIRGTAIFEATGVEETQLLINISTPHTRLAIDRQGLYRLNVVPNDATELFVRKGRVILGDTNTKIKGGNKVVFFATAVSVAKLTDQDKKLEKTLPVEAWSKDRAETLAQANKRINNRMLSSAFASFNDSYSFYGFQRAGLWFYNSRSSCYTFLPYGYTNSPYGVSYPTTIYGGYGGYGGGRGYPPVAGGSNGSYPGGTGGSASGGSGGGYSPSAQPVRTMPTMPAPSAPSMAAPRDADSGQRVRASPERP